MVGGDCWTVHVKGFCRMREDDGMDGWPRPRQGQCFRTGLEHVRCATNAGKIGRWRES